MPDITFIVPHWIYWGGILAVPAVLMFAARREKNRDFSPALSTPMAYFFWIVGGFMGLHRLYLKNWGAAVFIALFVGVIFCNHEGRQTRNAHSIAKNEAFNANYDLEQAQQEDADAGTISELQNDFETKTAAAEQLAAQLNYWRQASGVIAVIVLILLIADGLIIPRLTGKARARISQLPRPPPAQIAEAAAPVFTGKFERAVSKLNIFIGEFASYWTVIAVFVFYYEVIARYIFNSPTIWAHESMFLLFGMQYMLAGGFCLRENAHVRVDVIYMYMSPRARAISDVVTSSFFFIFTVSLLATGWIFFYDSFVIGQVSHTEWEISHWPVKFALPLGGVLIFLQGLARLLRDLTIAFGKNNGR